MDHNPNTLAARIYDSTGPPSRRQISRSEMIKYTYSPDAHEIIDENGPNSSNISVIIPVYNDPNGIRDTLNSLVNQDYPADRFEIIVVDNGSTDNTIGIVEEYINNYPELIRLVSEDSIQSSYAARNKGIVSSKGSVIAFIDADMTVDTDWLMKIDQSLQKDQWEYLACGVEIYGNTNSIYEKYNKLTGFPIKSYVNNDHYAPTCCLAVRKRVFDELGLFDSRFVSRGDFEFGNRVYRSGKELYYQPDIGMRHPARSSFKGLYKKIFRVGRGYRQMTIYYPDRQDTRGRRLWNNLIYLPNNPWDFYLSHRRNKIWNTLSSREKVAMYFIHWFLKLANNNGYWYETYRSGR